MKEILYIFLRSICKETRRRIVRGNTIIQRAVFLSTKSVDNIVNNDKQASVTPRNINGIIV